MPAIGLDYKAIGKRIKISRKNLNMTQETIAEKIGISPQHVSNIETGNTRVSLTTLVAIANLLNVSADELLCDTILIAKPVFEKEAKELFSDCNEYEIRVLVEVMKATKASMRSVKMFGDCEACRKSGRPEKHNQSSRPLVRIWRPS